MQLSFDPKNNIGKSRRVGQDSRSEPQADKGPHSGGPGTSGCISDSEQTLEFNSSLSSTVTSKFKLPS